MQISATSLFKGQTKEGERVGFGEEYFSGGGKLSGEWSNGTIRGAHHFSFPCGLGFSAPGAGRFNEGQLTTSAKFPSFDVLPSFHVPLFGGTPSDEDDVQADFQRFVVCFLSLGGLRWSDSTNWITTKPYEEWGWPRGSRGSHGGIRPAGDSDWDEQLEDKGMVISLQDNNLSGCLPLDQLPSCLNLLDVSGNKITSVSGHVQVHQLPHFKYLDLSQNLLSVEGTEGLAAALTKASGLRELSVADNAICGREDVRAKTVLASLIQLTALEYLDISKNRLRASEAKIASASLTGSSCCLKTLRMADNDIRAEGLQHIVGALQKCKTMTHLDVANNNIGAWSNQSKKAQSAAAVKAVKKLVTLLTTKHKGAAVLTKLDISHNSLGVECIGIICDAYENTESLGAMCSLNVLGNAINRSQVERLDSRRAAERSDCSFCGLVRTDDLLGGSKSRGNHTLGDFASRKLSTDDARLLACDIAALGVGQDSSNVGLVRLDLSSNLGIRNEGAKLLLEQFGPNEGRGGVFLDLSSNGITVDGDTSSSNMFTAASLVELMVAAQTVSLAHNNLDISTELAAHLHQAGPSPFEAQVLNILGNRTTEEQATVLLSTSITGSHPRLSLCGITGVEVELDFKSVQLSTGCAVLLATELMPHKTLKKLVLAGSPIATPGVGGALSKLLKANPVLTELDVSMTRVIDANLLEREVSSDKTDPEIQSGFLEALAEGLSKNRTLVSLNAIGACTGRSVSGAEAMVAAFKLKKDQIDPLSTICGVDDDWRVLDLSYRHLAPGDAVLLTREIQAQKSLTSLNLLGNDFGTVQADALVQVMKCVTPRVRSMCGLSGKETVLDFEMKGLTDGCTLLLANEIESNWDVTDMNLLHNNFGKEGARVLLAVFEYSRVLRTVCGIGTNTRTIELRKKALKPCDALLLAADMKASLERKQASVTVLDVSKNGLLTREVGAAFGDLLQMNGVLVSLDISNLGTSMTHDAKDGPGFARALAAGLSSEACAVKTLTFSGDYAHSSAVTMEAAMTIANFQDTGLRASGAIIVAAFLPKCRLVESRNESHACLITHSACTALITYSACTARACFRNSSVICGHCT
jgi:Ran GTPase-activating protein (RanGAP) involved in mRNA processing and transport